MRLGGRRGKEPAELDPALTQRLQALQKFHAERLADLARLQQEVAAIGSTRSTFEGHLAALAEQSEALAADEKQAAEHGRDDLVAQARERVTRLEAKVAEVEALHREAVQTEASLVRAERQERLVVDELTRQKTAIEDHAEQLRNLLRSD